MFATLLRLQVVAIALCFCGCITFEQGDKEVTYVPQNLPAQFLAPSRSSQIPIDYRHLGSPIPTEHTVGAGDVLGIYIADILGNREELPKVEYPNFRIRNAPIEPLVGQPIKVESNGTIHLPSIKPIQVGGFSIPQVRQAIVDRYADGDLIQPGKENVTVSLITPRFFRINVFRQDTRYNVPGLQRPDQFEISRRWSGTTLFLEPKEASVLTALLRTGGLPGIDARNEIWVMKGVPKEEIDPYLQPTVEKLPGNFPMMIGKDDTKLIKIPLQISETDELPFEPDDVQLGDGDIVFLPRRDGDVFITGGLMPPGRFPLARDRDIGIIEAIAIATGNNMGPVGAGDNPIQFRSGPGNIIPPTQVTIVRRISDCEQVSIEVDLAKAFKDPSERIIIAPGDVILLRYRFKELAGNVMLNFFDFNVSYTKGF